MLELKLDNKTRKKLNFLWEVAGLLSGGWWSGSTWGAACLQQLLEADFGAWLVMEASPAVWLARQKHQSATGMATGLHDGMDHLCNAAPSRICSTLQCA